MQSTRVQGAKNPLLGCFMNSPFLFKAVYSLQGYKGEKFHFALFYFLVLGCVQPVRVRGAQDPLDAAQPNPFRVRGLLPG